MIYETPCRVRDGVGFLEPTEKEREPLHLRGVHVSASGGESLKRMRGTHLREQVHEGTPTRHRGGGFLFFRLSAVLAGSVPSLV